MTGAADLLVSIIIHSSGSKGDELMTSSNLTYHHLPNREIEFRVCINIHEAKNLEGVDCNPVLRVACKCGHQVKKTKSVTGSISPKFNEVSSIIII